MKNLEIQKASAGSGKTFQLALTYIRMVLGYKNSVSGKMHLYYPDGHNTHREILAVTFTNKATEEMKERIIKELTLLSDPALKSDYRSILCEEFATDADTLARAAKSALNDILFDYGHFQVSTIDSFFQMILRSFAYEADLSGNYELELDENTINEQAINDTIGAAIGVVKSDNAANLRKWLDEIMISMRKDSKGFNFINPKSKERATLMSFVSDLTKEDFMQNPDDYLEFPSDISNLNALKTSLSRLKETSRDEIIRSAKQLQENHLDSLGTKKKPRLRNLIDKIAENGGTWPLPTKTYNDFWADDSIALDLFDPADSAGLELLKHLLETIHIYFTALVMASQIHNYGLFSEILNAARNLKISTNTILLSDTNALLDKIINDSDTPFIYERIGQRIKHFLIDEFQDTSHLQWENLHPLLLESLSNKHENLIIGDVKQCIYRFRNSDPKLLDHEVESTADLVPHIQRNDHGTNFRSARTIVEFNNELFDGLSQSLGFHGVYSTVRQKVHKIDQDGYVRISVANPPEVDALEEMIADIKRQLAAGYRPSDIAILAIDNDGAKKIVNFILSRTTPGEADPILSGVRVISDEALLISASPAVKYIVNQLRIRVSGGTAEPDAYYTSDVDMKRFEDILRDISENEDLPADQALDKALERFRNSQGTELTLNPQSRGLSLFETVEEIISTLPTSSWRRSESIYLCAFQDLVLSFCQGVNPSVYDFLEFWDSKGQFTGIALSGNDDAIRVMTIHKSKGLEFPCVHIPLMPKDTFIEISNRWFSTSRILPLLSLPTSSLKYFPLKCKSAEISYTLFRNEYDAIVREAILDRLNVLYVAFTRARRELCVTLNNAQGKENYVTTHILSALEKISSEEKHSSENGGFTFGAPTVPDPKDKKSDRPGEAPLTLDDYKVTLRNWWDETDVAPADPLD